MKIQVGDGTGVEYQAPEQRRYFLIKDFGLSALAHEHSECGYFALKNGNPHWCTQETALALAYPTENEALKSLSKCMLLYRDRCMVVEYFHQDKKEIVLASFPNPPNPPRPPQNVTIGKSPKDELGILPTILAAVAIFTTGLVLGLFLGK